jgi:hypothetical protein
MKRLALAALLLTGCALPTGDMVVYTAASPELAGASVSPEGIWESSPWSGTPWIAYPERITVQLEHTLGRAPRAVLVYLSFDADGIDPVLAAGDLASIVEVTETTITVRNDTNAALFVRVVAF